MVHPDDIARAGEVPRAQAREFVFDVPRVGARLLQDQSDLAGQAIVESVLGVLAASHNVALHDAGAPGLTWAGGGQVASRAGKAWWQGSCAMRQAMSCAPERHLVGSQGLVVGSGCVGGQISDAAVP